METANKNWDNIDVFVDGRIIEGVKAISYEDLSFEPFHLNVGFDYENLNQAIESAIGEIFYHLKIQPNKDEVELVNQEGFQNQLLLYYKHKVIGLLYWRNRLFEFERYWKMEFDSRIKNYTEN